MTYNIRHTTYDMPRTWQQPKEIARGASGSRNFCQVMPCHAGVANMPSERLVRMGSRQQSRVLELWMNDGDWDSEIQGFAVIPGTGYWVLGPEEERGLEA